MKKIIFGLIYLLVFAGAAVSENSAQNVAPENPQLAGEVKAHRGIDSIYKNFSRAYETLEPEAVADLYTENAAYLAPDDEIITGRRAILENFTSFFEGVRNRGQRISISFRILQRRVEKNIGYDVGIYTLSSFESGKKLGESKGKFVVVAVKSKDGKWRLQVDGYSGIKPQEN